MPPPVLTSIPFLSTSHIAGMEWMPKPLLIAVARAFRRQRIAASVIPFSLVNAIGKLVLVLVHATRRTISKPWLCMVFLVGRHDVSGTSPPRTDRTTSPRTRPARTFPCSCAGLGHPLSTFVRSTAVQSSKGLVFNSAIFFTWSTLLRILRESARCVSVGFDLLQGLVFASTKPGSGPCFPSASTSAFPPASA